MKDRAMQFYSCSLSEGVPPPLAINKGHLGNQKSKHHSSNNLIKRTTDPERISINNFTRMFVCIGKDNTILHLHCIFMVVLEYGWVVKQPYISFQQSLSRKMYVCLTFASLMLCEVQFAVCGHGLHRKVQEVRFIVYE